MNCTRKNFSTLSNIERSLRKLGKETDRLKPNLKYDPVDEDYIESEWYPMDEIYHEVSTFHPRDCHYLLNFFGLLIDKKEQNFFRTEETCNYFPQEFIDYETIQQPYEEDLKIMDELNARIYYQKHLILVVFEYPKCELFKIGKTIDECKYIGLCRNYEHEYEMFFHHLNYGEYDMYW